MAGETAPVLRRSRRFNGLACRCDAWSVPVQDWQPDREWVRKMADNLGDEWKVRFTMRILVLL